MPQSLTEKQHYWSEQLQRAENSGDSLADYARANHIDPQKLYQWRSALKKQTISSVTTKTHFAQVVSSGVEPLTVHFPAAQLSFNTLPDAHWLATLITATAQPR